MFGFFKTKKKPKPSVKEEKKEPVTYEPTHIRVKEAKSCIKWAFSNWPKDKDNQAVAAVLLNSMAFNIDSWYRCHNER